MAKKQKPAVRNLADLITKSDAARLRGITAPSFHELLARYPDQLDTVIIGGVEFVFRSQVLKLRTRKPSRAAA